jgi:glycine cleavage system regulatory protein
MTVRVLISFYSEDRPGVVEALSAVLDEQGGNWLDSQLSRLGGRFAGIVLAEVPAAQREHLAEGLQSLAAEGVSATLSDCGEDDAPHYPMRRVTVLGPDRPGIVRELTRALRGAGFNVQRLETSVETAAMSGEPLFRAEADIELLSGCRLDELEWELDAMAERMTLDIDIEAP